MTTFSRRHGYGPQQPPEPIIEDAPSWLRSRYNRILGHFTYIDQDTRYLNSERRPLGIKDLIEVISDRFRREIGPDARDSWTCQGYLDDLVIDVEWYNFYDIIEIVGQEIKKHDEVWLSDVTSSLLNEWEISLHISKFGLNKYLEDINKLFADENVGWRVGKNGLVERESPQELSDRIEEIEETLTDEFEPTRGHYRKAIQFANARPLDPENSIKEVVSAVESVGRILYPKAGTLGDVVKEMRRDQVWPQQLVSVIEKFYGYACSEPAIRHGGPASSKVLLDDAEFCLHVGAALIRYMIAYSRKRGQVHQSVTG